jgi:hypothetical protein
MEQEIKRRGRPKKVTEQEQAVEQEQVQAEEIGSEAGCGHNSLIEDGRGTYCALCGKRV